jgi:hypothetical protein
VEHRPLAKFGLASIVAKPAKVRELGPAAGRSCKLKDIDYAEAVEDALRRRPPANALLDAHFSINSGFPTCTRVEGMAVVVE